MTKPIVSVGAMKLYEQGRFKLDDPVALYIPACSNATVLLKVGDKVERVAPKRPNTIRYSMPKTPEAEDRIMPSALAVDPRTGRFFVAEIHGSCFRTAQRLWLDGRPGR